MPTGGVAVGKLRGDTSRPGRYEWGAAVEGVCRMSGTRKLIKALAMAFVLAGVAGTTPAPAAETAPGPDGDACAAAGRWLVPATGEILPAEEALGAAARHAIVLLGEVHDRADHHRWQLYTLAGLWALSKGLVVGFEMFPRAVQPALDAWSEGRSTEAEFLAASRWDEVWGTDPELYLPLFRFVRQNRLPMVALNVDRALVARVAREGWAAVPADAREGVSDPAPASAPYRRSLAEVYAAKLEQGIATAPADDSDNAEAPHDVPDIEKILASEPFARFVAAQLTWDRAMAEALAAAHKQHPGALVVGIVGEGHAEHDYGIPHQLADLGEADVAVLLPVDTGEPCTTMAPDLADVVFLLAPGPAEGTPERPRLGVTVEVAEGGLQVKEVEAGGVAEAAGLAPGDLLVRAAGLALARPGMLATIVGRQAPGTWLPLEIERAGEAREIVAKFPPAAP
jgi:uncharacterized iron-regulated protein